MSKTTPYLLTLSSDTDGIGRFLESIKNAGEVEHIAIQFQPFTNGLESKEKHEIPYPGHIGKYAYIPKDLEPERYVVFLDTDDVIIQQELPDFEAQGFDVYLAAENIFHRDTIYKKYISFNSQFEEIMDKPVYNSGSWAMRAKTLYQFLAFQEQIGRTGNLAQPYFNLWLSRNPQLSTVCDMSLFCPMFSNYSKGYIYKDDNGVWRLKHNDKVITVVHANGNNKNIL